MQALVITVVSAVVAGLFTVIGVLLKHVLDTKHALQPISNGFAGTVKAELKAIKKKQQTMTDEIVSVRDRQDHFSGQFSEVNANIRDLQAADDTLLELLSERRDRE